jgi:hypothetical protein
MNANRFVSIIALSYIVMATGCDGGFTVGTYPTVPKEAITPDQPQTIGITFVFDTSTDRFANKPITITAEPDGDDLMFDAIKKESTLDDRGRVTEYFRVSVKPDRSIGQRQIRVVGTVSKLVSSNWMFNVEVK